MAGSDKVIAKRQASLCFEKAEMTWLAGRVAGLDGRLGVSLARKLYGGDWVGGELRLTTETLHFMPGPLSRLALKQGAQFERRIALADIAQVTRRWMMMQHLIDLHLVSGETLSVRCEGATKLAALIERQAARLRPAPDAARPGAAASPANRPRV